MFLLTSDRLACNLKSDRIATCDDFSKKKQLLAFQIMHAKIEHRIKRSDTHKANEVIQYIETTHYHSFIMQFTKINYYFKFHTITIQRILTLYWRYQ